jgi:transcriptional regulator with XRE-family HTH domain
MEGRALLAFNIRRLRKDRGISQEDLAGEASVDRTYLSDIENEKGNPSVDILDRIVGILGVPLAELFLDPKSLGGKKPAKKSRQK